MKKVSQYRIACGCLLFAFSGCTNATGAAKSDADEPVHIVAIEGVYGDIARQLGGSGVEVTTILNSPSADPHAYEPTTRDAEAIAQADIVVQNGLGYDAFTDKLLAASPKSGRAVIVAGSLAGHRSGDNPHVWYEMRTLRLYVAALSQAIAARAPRLRDELARRGAPLQRWFSATDKRIANLRETHAGARVAITEPVFDYVLQAARLTIATPASFSHAIEEGNDPAPQDVEAMHALIAGRTVNALIYNSQTVEPSTTQLLDLARAAGVTVVPVTETLPGNQTTQSWIDGELERLRLAL